MIQLAVIIVAIIHQELKTHFRMVVITSYDHIYYGYKLTVQRACAKNLHKRREVLLLDLKLYESDSILVFPDISLLVILGLRSILLSESAT